MQERLVIYLHAHDLARPDWAVVTADNVIRESAQHDHHEGLAQIAEEKEVIVIVPAEDVLILSAPLPKMNRSRLLQALPFALEEQLIDDVDALHFAAGEYQANGELPVAIVAKTKMQQWMELLREWKIKPDAMIPLSLALPLTENTWHILIAELAAVRTAPFHAFTCDNVNLPAVVDVALSASVQQPKYIHIHNYTSHAFTTALDVEIDVKEDFLSADKLISQLARSIAHVPMLNLLQSAYVTKKPRRLPQIDKVWRVAAYLALAWVFLIFYSPIMSYFVLRHRVSEINDQIVQIYKRNFPQASSVVAPKLRMEEKLHKLSAQIGENRSLLLMGYIGKAMQQAQGVKLKRLDYQGNQLTLELTATSSEDFSAFTDFLTQQGLLVKQQNANLAGSHVNATVQVE